MSKTRPSFPFLAIEERAIEIGSLLVIACHTRPYAEGVLQSSALSKNTSALRWRLHASMVLRITLGHCSCHTRWSYLRPGTA